MSNFEIALNRLDNELHGQNYELYVFLHDVISEAIELEAQVDRVKRVAYSWKHSLVSDLDADYWNTTNTHVSQIEAAIKGASDG